MNNVTAARRLVDAGLLVVSTSTPALNGTYATSGLAAQAMFAEATAILLAGTTPAFADGTQSLNWPDQSGNSHTFTPAQFHELAVAVADFLVQCEQYANGLLTTAPAANATIA